MRRTIHGHLLSTSSAWMMMLAALYVAIVWPYQTDGGKFVRGTTTNEGVTAMSGKTDVVKGRIKEAAGALTGNDKLREDGQTDQAVGEVKQAVQKVADKVQAAGVAAVDKAKNATK
jgi:uncharacterized protein YjbJ (UPF0337 family)